MPIRVDEHAVEKLETPSWYIAAERLGPVIVHPVKRGPDKGMLVIEEVPSPVFHYERSVRNEQDELVAGRLWAELDVTDDVEDKRGKPLALRSLFEEIHDLFRKNWRRSDPKGFWVGPHAGGGLEARRAGAPRGGAQGARVGVWR